MTNLSRRKFYVSSGSIDKITMAECEMEACINVFREELKTENVDRFGLLTLVSERGFMKDLEENEMGVSGILIATCDILEELGVEDVAKDMRDATVKKHVELLQQNLKKERLNETANKTTWDL